MLSCSKMHYSAVHVYRLYFTGIKSLEYYGQPFTLIECVVQCLDSPFICHVVVACRLPSGYYYMIAGGRPDATAVVVSLRPQIAIFKANSVCHAARLHCSRPFCFVLVFTGRVVGQGVACVYC